MSETSEKTLKEQAGAGIEKGKEILENKVIPGAKNIAAKFGPDQVDETIKRGEERLEWFLNSKWVYALGALIALRPLLFGSPVLLAAVFLWLMSQGKPQESLTKRALKFALLSILAGIVIRMVFVGLVLLGALLLPDVINIKLG